MFTFSTGGLVPGNVVGTPSIDRPLQPRKVLQILVDRTYEISPGHLFFPIRGSICFGKSSGSANRTLSCCHPSLLRCEIIEKDWCNTLAMLKLTGISCTCCFAKLLVVFTTLDFIFHRFYRVPGVRVGKRVPQTRSHCINFG